MFTPKLRLIIVAIVVAIFLDPQRGFAICSSGDIQCPPSGLCTITGTWNIDDDCTLDFGARDLKLQGVLQAQNVGGSFTIVAHDLSIFGGKIRSIGDADDPGGDIEIDLSGAFRMYGTGSRISMNANAGSGALSITAASISLETGVIDAEGGTGDDCGDGGDVELEATDGPLTMLASIQAVTGGHDCSGGDISLTGTAVTISGTIDSRGGVAASPNAIFAEATTGDLVVSSSAILRADGTGQPPGEGAPGGGVALFADEGSVVVNGASITATGKSPSGSGGVVSISAGQDIEMDARLSLFGGGTGAGGQVFMDSGGDLAITGDISAYGGGSLGGGNGGSADIRATGQLLIDSAIDTSGAVGGGTVVIQTATDGALSGQVSVQGSIVAHGAPGNGGDIDVLGCQVDVAGTLDAGASTGGGAGNVSVFAGTANFESASHVSAVPCPTPIVCTEITTRPGSLTFGAPGIVQPSPLIATSAVPPC